MEKYYWHMGNIFRCPVLRAQDVGGHGNLMPTRSRECASCLIEATASQLLYLPPYPRSNPIEKALSKISKILRAIKARSTDNPRPSHR